MLSGDINADTIARERLINMVEMAAHATVQILSEDPELGENVQDRERLSRATLDCVARVFEHPAGAWNPPPVIDDVRRGIGLLVLDGLLVRHVGVAGRFGAELLGEGDVLCPWQWEKDVPILPRTSRARVLRACRLAILDHEFTERAGRYPDVISALVTRALQRARHISVNMAIVQQPRIDIRLHMLFWEMADRWGTVRQDGVHLSVPLTHATLADLVAARRPTVTKALGELAERETVIWTGQDWLLPGHPPAELEEVGSVSVAGPAGANGRTALERPAQG